MSDNFETFYIESVENSAVKENVHAKLLLNDCYTTVKIDTGAKCNVISRVKLATLGGLKSLNISKKLLVLVDISPNR
jgi:hypothetical protein